MGGLGNQMFQYAAARSLADELGLDLVLDGRYVERKSQHMGLAIDRFNVRARHIDALEGKVFSEPKIRLARWFKRLVRPVQVVFWETSFAFDKVLGKQPAGTLLSGFWQSERYINAPAKIRQDLQLTAAFGSRAQVMAELISSCPSVALHVRRGDYLKDEKTMARYGLCSMEYYNQALSHVLAKVGDAKVFVFSDDTQWVKCNLKVPPDTCFVSSPSISAEEDLMLMSQCQHQIIANSTFSWWGAWLNQNCDKIVVAPSPWFDDATIAAQDLIPASWHQIKK
jgi:hypothetical protein